MEYGVFCFFKDQTVQPVTHTHTRASRVSNPIGWSTYLMWLASLKYLAGESGGIKLRIPPLVLFNSGVFWWFLRYTVILLATLGCCIGGVGFDGVRLDSLALTESLAWRFPWQFGSSLPVRHGSARPTLWVKVWTSHILFFVLSHCVGIETFYYLLNGMEQSTGLCCLCPIRHFIQT